MSRRNLSQSMAVVAWGIVAVLAFADLARAETFGGVEFPDGVASFADEAIAYDPLYSGGPAPTASDDPDLALGPPNCCSGSTPTQVALGNGGLLAVRFTDNTLTNSGGADQDLWIFEGGSAIESTFIAVHPADATTLSLLQSIGAVDSNGDGYFEIGQISGSTYGIDLDSYFSGFAGGTLRFDAVQVIDDPGQGPTSGQYVGADIDAVGAIQSDAPSPAVCGDGLLGAGEGCDDGNTVPFDGCDENCVVEPGWDCMGEPSACVEVCGDNQVVGNEECDDGNAVDGDCCAVDCQFEAAGSLCSDSDACTSGDACDGLGACQPGSPLVCDDQEVCTTDSCDPIDGCQFVANALGCDDGNPCTLSDACSAGACVPGVLAADGLACGDGAFCNGEETCTSGVCISPGSPCEGQCDEDDDVCIDAAGLVSPDIGFDICANSVYDQDALATDVCSGGASPIQSGLLPRSSDLNGIARLGDGSLLIVADSFVDLAPGGLVAGPADVVRYDGAAYSLYFDGGTVGLPDGASIDAVTVDGGQLVFSLDTTVPLAAGVARDEDLIIYDGVSLSVYFHGSASGVPDGLGLDAAHYSSATDTLHVSFDVGAEIGGLYFKDEDLVEYSRGGGTWVRTIDLSAIASGWDSVDTDAVDGVPEPGRLLLLCSGLLLLCSLHQRRR